MREIVQKARQIAEEIVSRTDFRRPLHHIKPEMTEMIVDGILDVAAESIAATKLGMEVNVRKRKVG